MHVHLLVPGLFWPTDAGFNSKISVDINLLSLEKFLVRAKSESLGVNDYEAMLFNLFGQPFPEGRDYPIASLRRSVENDDIDSTKNYLCVDPVQLLVSRDSVRLLGSGEIGLTDNELRILRKELKSVFEPQGWALECFAHNRWYCSFDNELPLTTKSINTTLGNKIYNYMPEGKGGALCRALMNEAQMVLCASSINAEREKNGQPLVNGLWFYGAGRLPDVDSSAFNAVWANDQLAAGLAKAGGSDYNALPDSAISWLSTESEKPPYTQQHLFVLDGAKNFCKMGNLNAWLIFMSDFLDHWFEPFQQALVDRTLASLTLITTNGHRYHCTRSDLKRWWKKRKEFSQYA